jgi:predicted nucleic acid-binding protein
MKSVFVDSNVVIYSLNAGDPAKQSVAQAWLSRLARSGDLVLSPQVTNETYSVVTRKLRLHPIGDGVRDSIELLEPGVTAPLDFDVLRLAWQFGDRYQVAFWDALLLASANIAGCSHFLSEDLSDGQAYGAVTVVDPFRHRPEDVLGRAT